MRRGGVRELLPCLQAEGIRMGVVSNSSFPGIVLERELSRQALRDPFEFVISSADYGVRMPRGCSRWRTTRRR
jgi:FMN phosphatase YigB (HAD superfamily)